MIIFAGANKMIFNQNPNLKMKPLKQIEIEDYLPDKLIERIFFDVWNRIKIHTIVMYNRGKRVVYAIP